MPWQCMQCGYRGRGVRARDSHEIHHLHRELAVLKWKETMGEQQHSRETPLCGLAKDLAEKQRACDDARKALNNYIRNPKNAI